jgi:hypothetical protein
MWATFTHFITYYKFICLVSFCKFNIMILKWSFKEMLSYPINNINYKITSVVLQQLFVIYIYIIIKLIKNFFCD